MPLRIPRPGIASTLRKHSQEVAESGVGRILAVRGRRQVGKSTAITAFVESHSRPYLYATGIKDAPVHRQLEVLAEASLTSTTPLPDRDLLFSNAPASWVEFFNRLAVSARTGPITVVLDEFPWLIEPMDGAEGELQVLWDRTLEPLPILLILVGSDVAMMDRLAGHDRPLFGRVRPMVVPALNPAELSQALPHSSAVTVFDAFLVTGGYPRLAISCAAADSVDDFIRDQLSDISSELVVTARLSLDAEFTNGEAAYRVLAAIGGSEKAAPGFSDVVSAISDSADREAAKTATTRALSTLSQTKQIVKIDVPAGSAANSRLRRYRIDDPYLRFWFRFVERQVDNISRGRSDIALGGLDKGWSSWRGQAIEPIVRDGLARLAARDSRLGGAETVGAWWNRDNSVEIDLVARDADGPVAIGTVKWRTAHPLDHREVQRVRDQRAIINGAQEAVVIGVCPAGVREDVELAAVFTADDLLRAWQT